MFSLFHIHYHMWYVPFIYFVEYKYSTLCTCTSVIWLIDANTEVIIPTLFLFRFTDSPVVYAIFV